MDVLQTLRLNLPTLPKKLALAAEYALRFPDRIALQSMRGTAAEVGVTSPTMLRLARHVGFNSYEDFRGSFQSQLVTTGFGARAGALHDKRSEPEQGSLPQRLRGAAESNLRETFDALDTTSLAEAAKLIRAAPSCYLVATGATFWLASFFRITGAVALRNLRLVGAEYSVAAEGFGRIAKEDVVIAFGVNPCAVRTVDALRHASESSAHTIAITDHPTSPLAAHAAHTFCAPASSPHYYPSLVSMTALVEVLLATVVATGAGEEIRRAEDFENYRRKSSAYIEY